MSFERHPAGIRLRVFGQRSHHGAWGVALLATRRRVPAAIGAVLILHDRRDWRAWFRGGWQDV